MGRKIGLGRIWSFILGFRSLVARLVPFEWGGTKPEGEKNFGNGKCELIANFSATMVTSPWRERREVWREKRKVRIFGKGKCKLIANCANFGKEKCKFIANLARQWWRHFRLSVSLSVCIIGSAEAVLILCVRYIRWERERYREREKDGSDVTIVALKLAMSFALLLAKNVHLSIGEECCAFPCQKICTSVFLGGSGIKIYSTTP